MVLAGFRLSTMDHFIKAPWLHPHATVGHKKKKGGATAKILGGNFTRLAREFFWGQFLKLIQAIKMITLNWILN
jgi:hypothetical protein